MKPLPRGQLCPLGSAHPAALRLSRGTKPLWGLEGLSHAASGVRGSLQVTTVRRSGLGGCRAPGRHKSTRRRRVGGDVIVTFRARQRFSGLIWRCCWAVAPRERHSPAPAPAAFQAGVRSSMGMCPAVAPCSRGATGPHGGDGEHWQEV